MYKFKVVLAGDKNVGKTSLLIRFYDNKFYEDLKRTIGVDFKKKSVDIKYDSKEMSLTLNIWDFGGEEKFRSLFPPYVKGASAALILFDTTNKKSLHGIDNWIKLIDENAPENVIKLCIATKIDLKDKREVSKEEAIKFLEKYKWSNEIIMTSSKTGENVEEAFLQMGKELIDVNLQECKECGEFFSKDLKKCSFCGKKIEMELL